MRHVMSFLRNESGVSDAEAALLVVVVGLALAGAAFVLNRTSPAKSEPAAAASVQTAPPMRAGSDHSPRP